MLQVPEDDAIIEVHTIFRGRVQGVGFRATTRHFASQLGLKGTVRNCEDGSVEAYIQGPLPLIQKLFQLISHEIGTGQVSEIIQRNISTLHAYEDFQIIR